MKFRTIYAPDDISFETLREGRDWYFVEYSPPRLGAPFSCLNICVVNSPGAEGIAVAMEAEARRWLRRYSAPLVVFAYSADERLIQLADRRAANNLVAWVEGGSTEPVLRWEEMKDGVVPTMPLDRDTLLNVFADVPYKTGRQIEENVAKKIATQKLGWWTVVGWAVFVPLGVGVLEWWSDLLGLVVLCYAFFKAWIEWRRLTGSVPKSPRQSEKEEEELRMRHHHYHCERNPEGFARLMAENLRREIVAENLAEAQALTEKSRRATSAAEKRGID